VSEAVSKSGFWFKIQSSLFELHPAGKAASVITGYKLITDPEVVLNPSIGPKVKAGQKVQPQEYMEYFAE